MADQPNGGGQSGTPGPKVDIAHRYVLFPFVHELMVEVAWVRVEFHQIKQIAGYIATAEAAVEKRDVEQRARIAIVPGAGPRQ